MLPPPLQSSGSPHARQGHAYKGTMHCSHTLEALLHRHCSFEQLQLAAVLLCWAVALLAGLVAAGAPDSTASTPDGPTAADQR